MRISSVVPLRGARSSLKYGKSSRVIVKAVISNNGGMSSSMEYHFKLCGCQVAFGGAKAAAAYYRVWVPGGNETALIQS